VVLRTPCFPPSEFAFFFCFPFRAKQSAERTFLSKTFPDISHCHGCGPDSCLLRFPPAFHPGLLSGKNLPEHTAGQNLVVGCIAVAVVAVAVAGVHHARNGCCRMLFICIVVGGVVIVVAGC